MLGLSQLSTKLCQGRDYFTVRLRDGSEMFFTSYDFDMLDGKFYFYSYGCAVPVVLTTRDVAEIDFRYVP